MSDIDPRTWTPAYRIALFAAIIVGIVAGGLVGLAANELKIPGLVVSAPVFE
jgi:hypothetical protein